MPIFSRDEIESLLQRCAARSAVQPRDQRAFGPHRPKCMNAVDAASSDRLGRPLLDKPVPTVWHPALARSFLARRVGRW